MSALEGGLFAYLSHNTSEFYRRHSYADRGEYISLSIDYGANPVEVARKGSYAVWHKPAATVYLNRSETCTDPAWWALVRIEEIPLEKGMREHIKRYHVIKAVLPGKAWRETKRELLSLLSSQKETIETSNYCPESSPMTTKMKPIKITEEQDAAIEPLVKAAGDKSFSDLVRRLLAQEAARLSVEWPDNMPTPGEAIRKAQSHRWPKDKD